MPRGYAPMTGVSGLAGLMGGGLSQLAEDREADRLLKQDATRGQIGLYDAQARATTSNARQKQREVDLVEEMQRANLGAREMRADPEFLAQNAAYRLGVPLDTARRAMTEGAAAGLNPEQMRLLGETIASLHAARTESAEKGSGVGDIATLMEKSGMSAQRLAAPDLLATDPNKAAFTLAAGTHSQAPTLYSGMQGGIGTIGNFTGEQKYDPGLYQSRLAVERANANQSNASAASSYATAAKTRSETGRPQVFIDRGVQLLPGGSFAPITVDGKPLGEKPRSGLIALPVAALKVQNEALEAIGTSSAIDADLGEIQRQLEAGELDLGPLENRLSDMWNWIGKSTPNSRNYQSFSATLEKLRNDSLRLNKGVQTEGDSVRAWNELLANKNDPEVVKQRLAEIRAINRRGAELQKHNIDVLRQNYGAEPLDTTPQSSVAPAVGAGRGAQAAPSIPRISTDAQFGAADAPPNLPRAGSVVDGYRFRGGDPADPAAWEPIE